MFVYYHKITITYYFISLLAYYYQNCQYHHTRKSTLLQVLLASLFRPRYFGLAISATPTQPHSTMTGEHVFKEIRKFEYATFYLPIKAALHHRVEVL